VQHDPHQPAPEEYRRKARTPLKITLAVAAVAGVNACCSPGTPGSRWASMAEIDSRAQRLQTELDGLKPSSTTTSRWATSRRASPRARDAGRHHREPHQLDAASSTSWSP
jgi:hypothetical protein